MPAPKRHIKEEMAEATERTIKEFPEEHSLVKNIAGLFIEVLVQIEKLKKISDWSKVAVLSLGVRNFRLLYCSGDSIYNGFYDAGMILLRIAYENNLLMKYLTDNEKEAISWLEGKKLKPKYLRKKTADTTGVFEFLSVAFIHANVESLFSAGFSRINGKKFRSEYFPKFDREQAKVCLYAHIIFSWLSLVLLQYAFRDSLWKDEEWKNRFADWNEIMLHYIQKKKREIGIRMLKRKKKSANQ